MYLLFTMNRAEGRARDELSKELDEAVRDLGEVKLSILVEVDHPGSGKRDGTSSMLASSVTWDSKREGSVAAETAVRREIGLRKVIRLESRTSRPMNWELSPKL